MIAIASHAGAENEIIESRHEEEEMVVGGEENVVAGRGRVGVEADLGAVVAVEGVIDRRNNSEGVIPGIEEISYVNVAILEET